MQPIESLSLAPSASGLYSPRGKPSSYSTFDMTGRSSALRLAGRLLQAGRSSAEASSATTTGAAIWDAAVPGAKRFFSGSALRNPILAGKRRWGSQPCLLWGLDRCHA